MIRRARALLVGGLLALLGVAVPAIPARAQEGPSISRRRLLAKAFADISDRHRFSVGKVWVDGQFKAYGVLVRDGRLLTISEPLPKAPATPKLSCQFQSDDRYAAKLVARDERWNLALLAVEPEELVDPVALDEPTAVAEARTGRWVISVGTLPLPRAVGAVSAVHRAVIEQERPDPQLGMLNPAAATIRGGRRYREVFQHDSMLPPDGPQGMAMFDSRGRFVGLALETRSRGTSFAIPVHRIRAALPALLAGHSTAAPRPGFIGINAGFLDPDKAHELGIPGGVPIARILNAQGEPLAEGDKPIGVGAAGAKADDIIVKVDGHEVLEIQTLQEVVQLFNPGEKVVFTVLREGKTIDLPVQIAERPRARRR